jgi:hypothetical protein
MFTIQNYLYSKPCTPKKSKPWTLGEAAMP